MRRFEFLDSTQNKKPWSKGTQSIRNTIRRIKFCPSNKTQIIKHKSQFANKLVVPSTKELEVVSRKQLSKKMLQLLNQ